ncbi:GntR family transcriptional regulator [Streptomyces sp. NPDC002659]|uniref:GntR family transcriptional regulator n=1 Tax=Streptomyces sp. NPDC002659 TaxID=3364656 RepID=UPI00368379A3
MRFREELSIALDLDKEAPEPLYRQLARQIQHAVNDGTLPAGARVPATRTLADALGISRAVAVAAYQDLFAQGCLSGQHVGRLSRCRRGRLLGALCVPIALGERLWAWGVRLGRHLAEGGGLAVIE